MALSATLYQLSIDLSDVDRGVYEQMDMRIARQPSESADYLLMRILAYCLEYEEGISLTEGVAAGDEPAVWAHDLTGRLLSWIEVGLPSAERLHRGSRAAERTALYTHRDPTQLLNQLSGKKIHRAEEIPIYAVDPTIVEEAASLLERRTQMTVTRTDGQLYLTIGAETFTTAVKEYRL